MISKELNNILEEAKNKILSHHKGELTLPIRKSIWKMFGGCEFKAEHKALPTIGLKRRVKLATICVKKIIDIWNKVAANDKRPLEMLEVSEKYIEGSVDYEFVSKQLNNFMNDLINLGSDESYFKAALVGFAATHTVSIALSDERLMVYGDDSDLDDDYDPESWDTSYYTSLAYTDNEPWDENSNVEKRREFWLWYITEAVPQAYMAYNE